MECATLANRRFGLHRHRLQGSQIDLTIEGSLLYYKLMAAVTPYPSAAPVALPEYVIARALSLPLTHCPRLTSVGSLCMLSAAMAGVESYKG
jgi:hypothetical protein